MKKRKRIKKRNSQKRRERDIESKKEKGRVR